MKLEISYIVTYPCPRCGAELEAKTSRVSGWFRCPSCGRASLPPEFMQARPKRAWTSEPGVLIIGPSAGDRLGPVESSQPGTGLRIILASALFVSIILLLFSLLDHSMVNSTVFGGAALLLLLILVRPTRSRP